MEEPADVHTALAEMERKLRDLQRELTGEEPEEAIPAQGVQATAPPPPVAATPPPPATRPPPAATPPTPAATPPPAAQALLRAGPFVDIESLGRFEQALRALDGVEEVVLRGFEGDRALFDVRLAGRR
ncbi:MAG: hypothetical protein ABR521_07590 [Gaiellaceae bacterium]